MRRQGPCLHCGIKYTPLWRMGPPEKPVLCNACGSRWRIRGTLDGYIPKHAMTGIQSSQLYEVPLKQAIPIRIKYCRKPKSEEGSPRTIDQSAASGVDGNRSSSESTTFSEEGSEVQSINVRPLIWNPHIPKRKRSVRVQHILSPIGRLHRQLYQLLHEPEFSKLSIDQGDLITFHNDDHVPCAFETGLGAVLLNLPSPPKGQPVAVESKVS